MNISKSDRDIRRQEHKMSSGKLATSQRLVLMVDLDNTLLHSNHSNATNVGNNHGVIHWQFKKNPQWFMTKIRPNAKEFLQRMSHLFELHICTMGRRKYAKKMAQLLDEDGLLFGNRIHSADDLAKDRRKLKVGHLADLFPCGDHMVVILDDREDVWNSPSNLIPVKPYHFFPSNSNNHAIVRGSDTDDHLLHAETLLRKTHQAYFNAYETFLKGESVAFPDTKPIVAKIIRQDLTRQLRHYLGLQPNDNHNCRLIPSKCS